MTELQSKEGSDFFLSFTSRLGPKTECIVWVHYMVSLHTHVPSLITPEHVVVMSGVHRGLM